MSFDGFQREVLAELGLAVYALAGAPVNDVQVAESAPPAATSGLLNALLRAAAAADSARAEVLALCREFLAANPAPSAQARRALWPRLRHLRARGP